MRKITKTVTDGCTDVKAFLRRSGLSSTLIKRVKYGGILKNGIPVTVRSPLLAGDTVEIIIPDDACEGIEPISIPLEIIFEDDYIIAVNKPTNMPTHPSRGNSLPTLANAVMDLCKGEYAFRAVNRLDRDTSGIVLIAKDQMSAARLSEDMKSGKFNKKYVAIVSGLPEHSSGIIDAPIEREHDGSIKRAVRQDGKRAVTEYKLIGYTENGNGICEIILHTGRTHQIRVHMAHIGHPLVGDFLYGERDDVGYCLHCCELSFPHPETGEHIRLISAPPFQDTYIANCKNH